MATKPNSGDLPPEVKIKVFAYARAKTETRDIIDVEPKMSMSHDGNGVREPVLEMHLPTGSESTQRLRETATQLALCRAARGEVLKGGSTPLMIGGGVIYIDPETAVLRFGPVKRVLGLLVWCVVLGDREPPALRHIKNVKKICFDIDEFGLFHVPRNKFMNKIHQPCFVREKFHVRDFFRIILVICKYFPDVETVYFSTERPLLGWFPDQKHFPSKTCRGIHVNKSGEAWSPRYNPKQTVLTFWETSTMILSAFQFILPVPVAPKKVEVRLLAWTPQHDRREEIALPEVGQARLRVRIATWEFQHWMASHQRF